MALVRVIVKKQPPPVPMQRPCHGAQALVNVLARLARKPLLRFRHRLGQGSGQRMSAEHFDKPVLRKRFVGVGAQESGFSQARLRDERCADARQLREVATVEAARIEPGT